MKHPQPAVDGFLEELIIRRELADNFCFYEPNYDNIKCAPLNCCFASGPSVPLTEWLGGCWAPHQHPARAAES